MFGKPNRIIFPFTLGELALIQAARKYLSKISPKFYFCPVKKFPDQQQPLSFQ